MAKPWESIIPEVQEQLDEEKPSFVSRFAKDLGRGTALAGRTVAEGAYDVISPFTNAAAGTMNLGMAGLEATGVDVPGIDESYRFPRQDQAFGQMLTDAGLPEPQGFGEKALNFTGRVGTGYGVSRLATPAVMERLGFKLPGKGPPPPSASQLRSAAGQAYKAADDAGVVVSQKSLRPVLDRTAAVAKGLGYDEQLHPRIAAVLKRFGETTDDISFQDLEILRRVARNAASSNDASERKIAQTIINEMDDFVRGLSPSDVTAGNASQASAAIQQARNLYSRASKASEIEELIIKARNDVPQFSASGLENTLRREFRRLANNPRRMRLFNRAEQEAITRVAQGGPLGNALRYLGKLAPTGPVSGAASLGGGYAMGGPAGAMALGGAGFAGKIGATQATLRNVQNLDELVRRGGPAASSAAREAAMAAGAAPAVINFLWGEPEESEEEPAKKPWER